jgi:hypothetical protein
MSGPTDYPPPATILVDLDGVLAEYRGFQGVNVIGPPIPRMVARVKAWLAEGRDVRIFTARVSYGEPPTDEVPFVTTRRHAEEQRELIREWCRLHLGRALEVTNRKTYGAVEIWDDRAVQVVPNTGMTLREWLEEAKVSRPPRCFRGPATLSRRA